MMVTNFMMEVYVTYEDCWKLVETGTMLLMLEIPFDGILKPFYSSLASFPRRPKQPN